MFDIIAIVLVTAMREVTYVYCRDSAPSRASLETGDLVRQTRTRAHQIGHLQLDFGASRRENRLFHYFLALVVPTSSQLS